MQHPALFRTFIACGETGFFESGLPTCFRLLLVRVDRGSMIPTCSTLLFLVALPLLLEVEGFTAVPRLTLLSKSAATSSGRAKLRSVMTSMVATRDDEEAPILHRVQATGAVVPMPRAEVMVEALEQQLVHKKQRLLYLRKEMLELESQIKTEQDHLAITRAAHKKTHTHTHVHTHLHTHTPIAGQSSSEIPQSMTEGTAPSPDVPSRGQQAKKRAPGGVSRGGAPRGATLQDKQAATMTLIRGGHEVELREKMCARLGATYAILWKKKGERFMVMLVLFASLVVARILASSSWPPTRPARRLCALDRPLCPRTPRAHRRN